MENENVKLKLKGTFDKRKFTVFLLLLLVIPTVLAGVSYYLLQQSTLFVNPPATLVTDLPLTLTTTAGSYHEFGLNITSQANQAINMGILYKVNSSFVNIENNDLKLRILQNAVILAETSIIDVNKEVILNLNNINFNAGETKNFDLSLELSNKAANGTYTIALAVTPGTFTFK